MLTINILMVNYMLSPKQNVGETAGMCYEIIFFCFVSESFVRTIFRQLSCYYSCF